VTAKIRETSRLLEVEPLEAVDSLHMLRWVMKNTIEATATGLSEWASQGAYFSTTVGQADQSLLDEVFMLEPLYSSTSMPVPVTEAVQKNQSFYLQRRGNDRLPDKQRDFLAKIAECVSERGSDVRVAANSVDEECERELEKEVEQEAEVERQIAAAEPVKETDWNYILALGGSDLRWNEAKAACKAKVARACSRLCGQVPSTAAKTFCARCSRVVNATS